MEEKVYGGWNNDESIRKSSSSGGIFSAIAEYIIKNKGFVYGATLVNECGIIKCKHIECSTILDVQKLRGSKYMVSDMDNIFCTLKKRLDANNCVLFCGTPCQVGALKSFLRKDYLNLVTVDFICHGMPAPLLYNSISIELENRYGSKIENVLFREKSNSWEDYSMKFDFQSGETCAELARNTSYMKLFFSDMFLRSACYYCQFKGVKRNSDITLGDFWGIRDYHSISEDEIKKGVSIVLVHSEVGNSIIQENIRNCTVFESTVQVFDRSNIYIRKRAEIPFDIMFFRNKLGKIDSENMIDRITKGKIVRNFIAKIKRRTKILYHNYKGLPPVEYCYSCGACQAICPSNAIYMEADSLGFRYPIINEELCINCKLCEKICVQKCMMN